jgi:hypothetical protein
MRPARSSAPFSRGLAAYTHVDQLLQAFQDLACTYPGKFSITFTKLTARPQTISNQDGAGN